MSSHPAVPRVAIALGDPAGIGPEIAIKTAIDPRARALCTPVLFGDPRVVALHAQACGLRLQLRTISSARDAQADGATTWLVAREQFAEEPPAIGQVRASHGRSIIDSARAAIAAAMAGEVDAVVAAPQTETAIKAAGIEFDGYPSFVARCTGVPVDDAFLMICFDDKRIVHTTLHVSLRRALELITRSRVERVVGATHATLRRLGIAAPRIAVSGVNPHAGEDGMFGDEELTTIGPALAAARATGIDVDGPFGADTMFARQGFDAFVVMVHDQGHIAAKTLAFARTAGMTIGTPIVFSSVAHGSAYDIAGRNKASHDAMLEALRRVVGGVRGTHR